MEMILENFLFSTNKILCHYDLRLEGLGWSAETRAPKLPFTRALKSFRVPFCVTPHPLKSKCTDQG